MIEIPDCTHSKENNYFSKDGKTYCYVCAEKWERCLIGINLPFCDYCDDWLDVPVHKAGYSLDYSLCDPCSYNPSGEITARIIGALWIRTP